jgi:hypothetical protein
MKSQKEGGFGPPRAVTPRKKKKKEKKKKKKKEKEKIVCSRALAKYLNFESF